jgi:hypothetical protein
MLSMGWRWQRRRRFERQERLLSVTTKARPPGAVPGVCRETIFNAETQNRKVSTEANKGNKV